MNFFKTLSRGLYYRVRRVAKALKNWRKFGVIIFGSLFVASSLATPSVIAEGFYQVAIYPTHSEIELGQNKLYTAQAFLGTEKVTNQSEITWLVSKGGSTLTTAIGSQFDYTPTEAGEYTVNARGVYDNDMITWANTAATLIVVGGSEDPEPEPEPEPENAYYQVAIYPTYSEIQLGQSKLYTAQAFSGTSNVTNQSEITWLVSQSGSTILTTTGSQLNYTPTAVGTYAINARGTLSDKTAWANDPAELLVIGTPPPPVEPLSVTASVDRNPINTYDSTIFRAQAYRGGSLVSASYNWVIMSGSGYFANAAVQNATFYSTGVTGNVTVRVYATEGSDTANTTSGVLVQGLIPPPPPPINYIDVRITPQTQDVYPGNTVTYTARVYNRYNTNVTSGSSVLWSLPNSSAGYIQSQNNYGSYSQVVIRADGILGTFPVRAQAWYGSLYDWDEADMDVEYRYIPPVPTPDYYWLTASLHGVIEGGGVAEEGDVIIYTLRLANYQPNTVHNVFVTMPIPTYTTFSQVSSAVDDPYISDNRIRWSAGDFVNGQVKTMYVRVRINEDLPSAGVAIRAHANVVASEISNFDVYSNPIYVGGTGGYEYDYLVDTGIEIEMLAMIALASLALSFMTYAYLNRREIRTKIQG